MHQLTNIYQDCKLITLEPGTPGGPFVVTQLGFDPQDPRMTERLFLLQRDGTWIDQIAHPTLPPAERFHVVFDTLPEVMATLGKLTGTPEILRLPVSEAQLREHVAALQAAGTGDALVRGFLASYRAHQTSTPRQS
jgi:hypothetical protein